MSIQKAKQEFIALIVACLVTFPVTLSAQCPEITCTEKYDHEPSARCRANGWDTLVNCKVPTLILHANPFVTTQHFNGTYLVESIQYNPPDPTFHAGQHLNINSDDQWENSAISLGFEFMFFGKKYTQAVVGSNGIVTFNLSQIGQHCAYQYNTPIPKAQATNQFVSSPDNSHNAIYGVYEDIDPGGGITSSQGMFRHVGGEFPCRYLCASVNEVPLFPYSSHTGQNGRCTYQIVCYEGTNIIEVHIKRRSCCSSTNSGKGIVGIQNETGLVQESHFQNPAYLGDYTFYIHPDSPAAFTAPGRNGWTDTCSYEAWRFTPQGDSGSTAQNISWWKLIDDGYGNIIDSVQLTSNHGDTNGFYLDESHTSVSVSPTRPTRYMMKCLYRGANGHLYGNDGVSMRDTIFVGVDTAKNLTLHTSDSVICEGQGATVTMQYPNTLTLDSCAWSAKKIYNGADSILPDSMFSIYGTRVVMHSQDGNLHPNHIDSVRIFCTASFTNGCNKYDSILVITHPNYHYYDTMGICAGQSYSWCEQTLTQPGDYTQHYYSEPRCDSNRHLHLMVFDLSHSVDQVLDCKAYTWLNGKTYTQTNTATRNQDTVILQNEWGCDSVVTLDFTFIPMKAVIAHTPEVATLDQLSIELVDESYGHDSRRWLLPDGATSTDPVTYINFPLRGIDTISVRLAVHNNFGCDDTAKSNIPLLRISEFIPNVFTPDRSTNNRFYPVLQGTVSDLQMWIFNRRGQQVAYFTGADGYWDGTDNNGERCPQGVYVYVLRFRNQLEPSVTQELTGTVTLVR